MHHGEQTPDRIHEPLVIPRTLAVLKYSSSLSHRMVQWVSVKAIYRYVKTVELMAMMLFHSFTVANGCNRIVESGVNTNTRSTTAARKMQAARRVLSHCCHSSSLPDKRQTVGQTPSGGCIKSMEHAVLSTKTRQRS
jgi:hypothetical protein